MPLEGDIKGELETKLTTQTFAQAGGIEVHPDLEIGGVVTFELNKTFGRFHAMCKLNDNLDRIARDRGYTHVFGIVYERDDLKGNQGPYIHVATGTGYKPRE